MTVTVYEQLASLFLNLLQLVARQLASDMLEHKAGEADKANGSYDMHHQLAPLGFTRFLRGSSCMTC
jgi:hypothetical protein